MKSSTSCHAADASLTPENPEALDKAAKLFVKSTPHCNDRTADEDVVPRKKRNKNNVIILLMNQRFIKSVY